MSFLSKQFEDVLCFLPVLNLDEGDNDANLEKPIQDVKFTNILKRYLTFREKDCKPLDKFRLRMAMDTVRKDIVEKLLRSFAAENSVKELDLSLKSKPRAYCLNLTLLNLKSLTISLKYVRIKGLKTCFLPSLKTMALKSIHWPAPSPFSFSTFSALLSKCPSIEYLSLTSCDLLGSIDVSNSSVKTLEIRDCNFQRIVVHSSHLKCFTLVSKSPELKAVGLHGCENLKYVNIRAEHLPEFVLYGCTEVEAIMDAPNLGRFNGHQERGGMNGKYLLSDFQWSRDMLTGVTQCFEGILRRLNN